MIKVTMWRNPIDTRYNGDFKIRDMKSVEIFIKDCIQIENYEFKDVKDSTMYYNIMKDKEGRLTFSHTKYGDGILPPIIMEYEDIPKKIYKARKSVNEYFFNKDN